MPLNYLQLQEQVARYSRQTELSRREAASKLEIAQKLLDSCSQRHSEIKATLNQMITSRQHYNRCALLGDEPANSVFNAPPSDLAFILLASDGSQIIPNPHDALPVALVNISRLCYEHGSGQAPHVEIRTQLLPTDMDPLLPDKLNEDLIALKRDVEEIRILAEWHKEGTLPVIALGDGPLELFHQPRSGAAFSLEFDRYQAALTDLCHKGFIIAGYTDRPRANLVVKMLEFSIESGQQINLDGLEDLALFNQLLAPGQRSAVFGLWSSSSQKYSNDLALNFFYLNVGSKKFPWIARVEIPTWVSRDPQQVNLLQQALLSQCQLMGKRPYPYMLHRAHEEAVVHFDEREQLMAQLVADLQRRGLGLTAQSNKLNAKELQSRTRMAK